MRSATSIGRSAGDLLADVCCGTGLFARALLREVRLQSQIVAVDASVEMLERIQPGADAGIRPVAMDAQRFAEFPVRCDKILLEGALGHFPDAAPLFRALRERLADGGRLVVADLSPDSQTWLFKEARRRWESLYRGPEEVAELLVAAEFEVEIDSLAVCQKLAIEDLVELVARRYAPVLASFDDSELRDGTDEILERSANSGPLDVVQRFDLIIGLPG